MSNIKELFLSSDNLTLLFNIVSKRVNQHTSVSISNEKQLQKTFHKMSKIVFESVEPSKRSLQILNQVLSDKSTKFFIEMISKKNTSHTRSKNSNKNIRSLEENNIRVNMRPNPQVKDNQSINQRLKDIENQRNNMFSNNTPQSNPTFEDNTSIPNNTGNMYQNLVNSRRQENAPNMSMKIQNEEPLNILSYSQDDINGLPMNNINPTEYNSNIDVDQNPMDLYKLQNQQRQSDESDYKNLLNNQESFEHVVKNAENTESINLEQITKERNEKGKEFYESLQYNSGTLSRPDSFMFKDAKFRDDSNDFKLSAPEPEMTNQVINQNPNYDLLKKELFEKQSYIERTHMITISSLDRNWENNRETRYNYQVKFKTPDDSNLNNAYIRTQFKNVVSVQLVKAFLPYDTTPVPFDFRMNIGLQTYPYLVLNIEELNNVYSGTNKNIDHSFAHLVFDKDYKSQIFEKGAGDATAYGIDDDGVANDDAQGPHIPVSIYEKQFTRGNYGYIPVGLEKKIFYPAPLASLNNMTINLRNPYGESLNVLRDNLSISKLQFINGVATSNSGAYQISGALGFPTDDDSSNGYHVIVITTNERFSNRNFSIGDRIRIKNCTVTSDDTNGDAEFTTFLNRDEGHYIINLAHQAPSATNTQDFINTIHIAPMGRYDPDSGTLLEGHSRSGYYQASDGNDVAVSSNSNLINMSLQNSLVFKVVTREKSIDGVMNVINA
jgi:hypothetical protein